MLKIFIAKFETLVVKMLSYSVYFEIKHRKLSTCVLLLSTCVCEIWMKKSIGHRNFGKTA